MLAYRKPADVWAAAEVAAGFAPANAELARYAFAANTFEALWMQAARHRDKLLGVNGDEGGDGGDSDPDSDADGEQDEDTHDLGDPGAALDEPIPFGLAADVPAEVGG